ncbi:MAG: carbohydrate ABC transporter permease [Anaerolineaceae bacterium]|jgi:ABC-type glycerol-3-phosphate transport system permease component|nr:carbohydrate ABC transporter permease [Anaerolineaceae bacterium]MDD4042427.1 carbohydrate ABC transporter permease [Anaerolineaceae bacterium]MDD4578571.1 carbohydrate ABC transporter permease [Anaerolineaceae bacterium]
MTVTTNEKITNVKYKSHRQAVVESGVKTFFRYLLLIVIGIIMLLPFVMAFLGTVKTDQEILAYPPKFFPEVWHWDNWSRVWNTDLGQGGTFPRWIANTAFLSVSVAVSQALFGSMAAYAFSRLKFAGRDAVFNFMLATMMIPGAVTLIPAYVLMTKLQLINSFWSLILPGLVSAGSIFTLTSFFRSIPVDLEEAAIIDGATHMQIFTTVILPLARPAILTVLILQFQGMWNSFMQPLLYLNSPDKYVLNVALSIFQQQYKSQWNLTLVGAMFNAIPVLILFFIFSRYYIEGVSYAGIKG